MRFKEGVKYRPCCGYEFLVLVHLKQKRSTVIKINETAAMLFQEYHDKDFTPEDMAKTLVNEYEIDFELALKDATALLKGWNEAGLINND